MIQKNKVLGFIIIFIGLLIFASFFVRARLAFEKYKTSSIQTRILGIKNARVGKVFRLSGSDEFRDLYIEAKYERLLIVDDSISKPINAEALEVYRQNKLIGTFPIIY